MRNTLLFFALSVLVFSCGSNGDDTSADHKDSTAVTVTGSDTITFTIESIDKELYCSETEKLGYCQADHNRTKDSLVELQLLKDHGDVVKRSGNNIEVITKKGKQVFKSKIDRSGLSDDVEEYLLHAVYKKLVVLVVYYYESYVYQCIDLETGQVFQTWGVPVPNAGENMVMAGNSDLVAAFTNNGLQLYVNDGKQWNLKMQRFLDDWGPFDLYWYSDTEVLSKKETMVHTDTAEVSKIDYVKIVVKHEKMD